MAREREEALPLVHLGLLAPLLQKTVRNRISHLTQTEKEWQEISACFGGKNILLMKYEARALEKSSERVRWASEEQEILTSCVK